MRWQEKDVSGEIEREREGNINLRRFSNKMTNGLTDCRTHSRVRLACKQVMIYVIAVGFVVCSSTLTQIHTHTHPCPVNTLLNSRPTHARSLFLILGLNCANALLAARRHPNLDCLSQERPGRAGGVLQWCPGAHVHGPHLCSSAWTLSGIFLPICLPAAGSPDGQGYLS